jgi:toxin ParE1/3/4
MTIQILISSEAEADITEAFIWYQNQNQGLGNDFLLCIEAVLSQIERNPEAFQLVHRNIRRSLVKRFPDGVFYIFSKNIITVIAVFHAKRNPRRWQRRQ